jgi:hypothetical protein
MKPTNPKATLVFQSKRGGSLYWARSVPANLWPRRLKYRTMILVRKEEVQ